MRLRRVMGILFALALAAGLTLPAAAEQGTAEAFESDRGRAEYMKYCAACHGVNGDGLGMVAPVLKTAPADLTRLGERYGLPLPRPKLVAFIDGRKPLISHGSREMPVWGKRLWADPASGTPEMQRRGTILVILDYIESIQAP
jgi:mono/diheme cytochrome c family protein